MLEGKLGAIVEYDAQEVCADSYRRLASTRVNFENMKPQGMPLHHPLVSVICPVYNDPAGVSRTLESLLALQAPPGGFEVVVIDNGSTDETAAVVENFASKSHGLIIAEYKARRGSYAARNHGIELARGDLLAFIDADMTVPHCWLVKGVQLMADDGPDYVGCRVVLRSNSPQPTLAERYEMALAFPVERYVTRDGFAPTACLWVRRTLIERIGSFDSNLQSGGDMEFGHRARADGARQVFDSENLMWHPARRTLNALARKHSRVVNGLISLRRRYPQRYHCNRLRDLLSWLYQLTPIVSLPLLRTMARGGWRDVPTFWGLTYLLRLEASWIKFRQGCLF